MKAEVTSRPQTAGYRDDCAPMGPLKTRRGLSANGARGESSKVWRLRRLWAKMHGMEWTPELLEKMKVNLAGGIPAVARTGIEILELEKGYVKMKMPLEGNVNHVQMMYAGSLFTLAELPGGAIFATSFDSRRFYPIVRDMSIRFRRPAKTDITVEVRLDEAKAAEIAAEAEREGKADYEWNCELKDESGEVVAITHNIYQLRKIGS